MVKKTDLEDNVLTNKTTPSDDSPNAFVTSNTKSSTKPTADSFNPELPRRVMEIPGGPRQSNNPLSINRDASTLTVGRNICLKGEIIACEILVIEGQVEATLRDARIIEVSEAGCFKGSADVTEASISGKFTGTLIAKDLLTIRKGGHVEGSIRYGKIIIEAGGTITGDMASIGEETK